jgi:nitronate monooxygenase
MAGGPTTPELAGAVSDAGGLGFLAAGYQTPDDLRADVAAVRALTQAPFGINLFSLAEAAVDDVAIADYARLLEGEASGRGASLGEPRFDDDAIEAKLEVVVAERPAVVSFTFGCPSVETVERLHEREIAVWITVTEVDEAREAVAAGADALVLQGVEAGGHRGSFADLDGRGELSVLSLLSLVAHVCDLPLVASGGIADGRSVAATLVAGARAAQLGTAFMRCPEAGTSDAHRTALAQPDPTALTRAFTGRRARGIVNRFMRQFGPYAPAAYPHVNHLTSPIRAAARRSLDPDAINLWAGVAHELAEEAPAAELVVRFAEDARAALATATARLEPTIERRGLVGGLDHVQVAAPPGCEAEARRFYGELLGLAEVDKPESLRDRGGVWFAAGAQQFHVGVTERFEPARKAHPALRVHPSGIDELAAGLEVAGRPVVWDEEIAGVRRFFSEDPWGNRVELLAAGWDWATPAGTHPPGA